MHEISSSTNIDFSATGKDAILQNARFLLATVLNTCPMARDMGWDPPVDESSDVAQTKTAAQIVDMFAKYLPEITIEDITFEMDSETGRLSPKVKVMIDDA